MGLSKSSFCIYELLYIFYSDTVLCLGATNFLNLTSRFFFLTQTKDRLENSLTTSPENEPYEQN